MYNPLESILYRNKLSDLSVLEMVDEYSLYCHYLEFQPLLSTGYHSVIRREGQKRDTAPSFSIFYSNKPTREFMWKDSGLGEAGDIFKLIKILYNLSSIREALEKVNQDFKLGFHSGSIYLNTSKITLNDKPQGPSKIDIRIKSQPFTVRDIEYWSQYGVTSEILHRFKVKSIKYYWLYKEQVAPFIPNTLTYSYEVLSKYKLYKPFATKGEKFRNDLSNECLEGFAQLTYSSDTLIITKSTKDIMTLASLGYESVSPRGENILIPKEYLTYLASRYRYIYILFDNDMKHKGEEYPFPKVYVPLSSKTKDISDYRKAYGKERTLELLNYLITSPLLLAA